MSSPELTIGLVAHHAFCPRRAWLAAAGDDTDTAQVAAGIREHRAVDDASTARRDVVRAVPVASVDLSLHGRVDQVRREPDGWVLREHKATPLRKEPTVRRPMQVQMALQAMCLVEMGWDIVRAEVYFSDHNVVVPIPLTEDLFGDALTELESTVRTVEAETAPPPLEDDPRCRQCSHVGVCLPDERRMKTVRRRIRVSDPDSQVVYLTTQGSFAHVSKGRLVVVKGDQELGSVPLERVQAVQVMGNVDLSSGLIRELMWRNLPVVWTSSRGRTVGWAVSAKSPNGRARERLRQIHPEVALDMARQMIHAKIANQGTQMRRLLGVDVSALRSLQKQVLAVESIGEVFGVEGDAAARYFGYWAEFLSSEWQWPGRRTRGAGDAVNASLNFVYSLLVGDCIRALALCGLDPHAGVLHSSSRNKPALALDLMEEFRPVVGDSVVIDAIRRGRLKPANFRSVTKAGSIDDSGRQSLVRAYEQRMSTEFKHPIFGYSVSWRRAVEVQARQILGVCDGSQPDYRGIRMR